MTANEPLRHAQSVNAEVNKGRHTLPGQATAPGTRQILLSLRAAAYNMGLLLEEMRASVARDGNTHRAIAPTSVMAMEALRDATADCMRLANHTADAYLALEEGTNPNAPKEA